MHGGTGAQWLHHNVVTVPSGVCVWIYIERNRERARPANPARLVLPQNVGGFHLSYHPICIQVGKAI